MSRTGINIGYVAGAFGDTAFTEIDFYLARFEVRRCINGSRARYDGDFGTNIATSRANGHGVGSTGGSDDGGIGHASRVLAGGESVVYIGAVIDVGGFAIGGSAGGADAILVAGWYAGEFRTAGGTGVVCIEVVIADEPTWYSIAIRIIVKRGRGAELAAGATGGSDRGIVAIVCC